MRSLRPLVAALAAAATLLGGVALAQPAAAAGKERPRVIAVAASDDFLVYRQKTGSAYDLSFPKGSTLYSVGKDLKRHRITGIDPEGFPSLQGSVLTQAADPVADDAAGAAPTPSGVRWRDLRTGAKGTALLPATDVYVGAAPRGWLVRRAVTDAGGTTRTHVVRYTTGGATTDLGAPIAGSSTFGVVPGPKGVVVVRHGGGLVRYLPYATGRWRTVYAWTGGHGTPTCVQPSATHLACDIDTGRGGRRSGQVLLSLDGRTRTWLGAHPDACQVMGVVVVGRGAIGKDAGDLRSCKDDHLTRLGADGRVTRSVQDWGPHASGLTPGLGGLLLSSPDQRRIVRLGGVTGESRTIVTAR